MEMRWFWVMILLAVEYKCRRTSTSWRLLLTGSNVTHQLSVRGTGRAGVRYPVLWHLCGGFSL